MKTCTKCGITKSIAEFSPRKSAKDGLYSWCLACNTANSKLYYRLKNPKKFKIIPDQKACSQCSVIKPIGDFRKNKRIIGGRDSICKVCDARSKKEQRTRNPELLKLRSAQKYQKNKSEWLTFFQEHYGLMPQCEICQRQLKWQSEIATNSNNVVNWDHYTDASLEVKTVPSSWLASHICDHDNRAKWLSFNFGILCNACNPKLPTKNRQAWLNAALEYVRSKNGIRV